MIAHINIIIFVLLIIFFLFISVVIYLFDGENSGILPKIMEEFEFYQQVVNPLQNFKKTCPANITELVDENTSQSFTQYINNNKLLDTSIQDINLVYEPM
jgi:hypothetical protein